MSAITASTAAITHAELIAALEKARQRNDPADAKTANELIAEHGIPRDRMLAALRAGVAAGTIVVHRVIRRNLLGVESLVPAYTRVPQARKRSK